MVCKELCQDSKTAAHNSQEGSEVGMEKEQQKTFNRSKQMFTTELVLVTLDLNKELRIKVNASDYMMGGVLSVKYKNEK